MKKVFAILAIVALASCGGSTETEITADTTATTVDTVVVPAVVDTAAAAVDSAAAAVADTTKK